MVCRNDLNYMVENNIEIPIVTLKEGIISKLLYLSRQMSRYVLLFFLMVTVISLFFGGFSSTNQNYITIFFAVMAFLFVIVNREIEPNRDYFKIVGKLEFNKKDKILIIQINNKTFDLTKIKDLRITVNNYKNQEGNFIYSSSYYNGINNKLTFSIDSKKNNYSLVQNYLLLLEDEHSYNKALEIKLWLRSIKYKEEI